MDTGSFDFVWLGVRIRTRPSHPARHGVVVSLPDSKLTELRQLAHDLASTSRPPVRKLQRFCGKLAHARIANMPRIGVAASGLRGCLRLAGATGIKAVGLTAGALAELRMLATMPDSAASTDVLAEDEYYPEDLRHENEAFVASDACNTGIGIFVLYAGIGLRILRDNAVLANWSESRITAACRALHGCQIAAAASKFGWLRFTRSPTCGLSLGDTLFHGVPWSEVRGKECAHTYAQCRHSLCVLADLLGPWRRGQHQMRTDQRRRGSRRRPGRCPCLSASATWSGSALPRLWRFALPCF